MNKTAKKQARALETIKFYNEEFPEMEFRSPCEKDNGKLVLGCLLSGSAKTDKMEVKIPSLLLCLIVLGTDNELKFRELRTWKSRKDETIQAKLYQRRSIVYRSVQKSFAISGKLDDMEYEVVGEEIIFLKKQDAEKLSDLCPEFNEVDMKRKAKANTATTTATKKIKSKDQAHETIDDLPSKSEEELLGIYLEEVHPDLCVISDVESYVYSEDEDEALMQWLTENPDLEPVQLSELEPQTNI